MRPFISRLKKWQEERHKPQALTGVEVGVQAGENAKAIIDHLLIHILYLVDPYLVYWAGEENWDAELYRSVSEALETRDRAVRNLKPNKVRWILKPSHVACQDIDDGALDFCYLDGDHSEWMVWTDLNCWYKKVRVGGVLCGHDYEIPSVGRTVDRFHQTMYPHIVYETVWYGSESHKRWEWFLWRE